MEYGDGWDLMSFATTTFQFPIAFNGTTGLASVGLNARNLEALGAVPQGRMWQPTAPDFAAKVTLDPLNQPAIGNHGSLVIKFPANVTNPERANGSWYTVEFRRKAGWDRMIPEDAVLVHEVRANGASYLQPGVWGRLTPGQQFVTPDPKIFVRVITIDAQREAATVWVWDLPEGSLRREESKPQVYLMQAGQKRWVASPQALTDLHKTFADVRVVPDGSLAAIPNGPDAKPLGPAPTVDVPNLVGLAAQSARAAVTAAGLSPSLHGPLGSGAWVRTQSPVAGRHVARGSTVSLNLATGPQP